MAKIGGDRLGPVLARFGLYLLTGLVLYTVVRLGLNEFGVDGWYVPVAAILVTLAGLELLTRVGWLTNPLADEAGRED